MLEVIRDVECFSQSRRTVLVAGEPGTGKEHIALALHRRGTHPGGPFIPFNCDHTSPDILKATLFGTEPGIYTDAVKRDGLTQNAAGGTIFLDEIADLHPESQSVLMRFLESGEVQRMGSSKTEEVDVRIVTATNRPIEAMTQRGHFRQDLYDRICRIRIVLPPLRERREDIPHLAAYFIANACRELGRAERALDDDALSLLIQHDWPSNVRQLEDLIHRLVARSHWPLITMEDVKTELSAQHTPMRVETSYQEDLEDLIRTYHVQLLARYKTVAEAARQKRCDPSNLRRKLKDLGIDPGQSDTDESAPDTAG
jgi:DNA-binding NtrC family response regulator